ncbi:CRS2-associated factor 2 mitochondrial [Tripterygium wilfordii]|uniref:CRS2-associated factor 2 mitochondrial n=1 Tax=Tripterygium wilfordii TaxID=458696 RepID=A0A7J7C9Z2_TRIWF|nr:CRS2-associated factor 2, mitochondrial [Tripterygium wilfordii]KAF5730556.1 CRS2-associated factor 2 mitochondrial [Tripterygium wilfordii]
MLKLLSSSSSTPKTLITSPATLLFFARFLSQSFSDDLFDPPFTPKTSKTVQNDTEPGDDPPFSPKPTKTHKTKPKKTQHRAPVLKEEPKGPVRSDLPFDFRYSYSETDPNVEPIGYREPKRFSPFGPGRLDRKWTGICAVGQEDVDSGRVEEERKRILGDPLTEEEVAELVEQYRHSDCNRQINLGKGGVTHNMLDDIHNHWKRAEAVRIKCLGVPTLDMDNVCFHLQEKSGGKIIYRQINILLIYRGRNYDSKNRPAVPLMLWKPYAPIYPRLVKNVADGLTFEETKELRNRGLNTLALTKLTRNGVYVNVVERVREAFNTEEVVRLDCTHVGTSDCKKIGLKLRELVPCVPILFKDEQIILWRGKSDQKQEPHPEPDPSNDI